MKAELPEGGERLQGRVDSLLCRGSFKLCPLKKLNIQQQYGYNITATLRLAGAAEAWGDNYISLFLFFHCTAVCVTLQCLLLYTSNSLKYFLGVISLFPNFSSVQQKHVES